MMRPSVAFAIIWIGWIVSWIAASFWSARTEKRVATWPVWVSRARAPCRCGFAVAFDAAAPARADAMACRL